MSSLSQSANFLISVFNGNKKNIRWETLRIIKGVPDLRLKVWELVAERLLQSIGR